LVVKEGFQASLRDLGLIRGVRGVPARVFHDGSTQDRRCYGSVIAKANERAEREICGKHFFKGAKSACFGAGRG
jgi:hypothetical protein